MKKVFIISIWIFVVLLILFFVINLIYTKAYSSSSGFSGESYVVYCGTVFEYNLVSDAGYHYNQFGYISRLNDKYFFNDLPFFSETSKHFPKQYYKIPWGDREYLIEEKFIYLFCNYINSGLTNSNEEFNFIHPFLVSNYDPNELPEGKPIMPEEYKIMIFESPINAEVVEKFPKRVSFKINKGLNDNLYLGCVFYDNNTNYAYEIIKMDDTTSILQDIIAIGSKHIGINLSVSDSIGLIKNYASLKIGDRVSTVLKEN